MRTKEEMLYVLQQDHLKHMSMESKNMETSIMTLEVLIDLRDIGQCFYERLIDFIKASE